MKVAQFISTTNIGGAETMLARLSIQLSRQGHEITIYHFGNTYLQNICHQNKISQVIIPFEALYRSIFTVHLFSLKFAKLLKHNKIDLLHSHLYGSIGGSFLGTYLYNIPHIATMHDVYMVQERIGRGVLLRIAQAMNVQLVSVSQNMKAFYENYIPRSSNIINIYNGFEWNEEQKNKDDVTPIPALPPSKQTRIVTVARLIKLKGHKFLLTALADTLKKHNAQLLIVGNGPEKDNIDSHIDSMGLQEHVTMLGERNDVHNILLESDIFVLASTSEGLSCSIIEAMSSGLPCVVSNVGGNPELVKDGINGFVFELDDKKGLSNAVNSLISSPEERISMGEQSQQIAIKDFNIETMVNSYSQLYSKISANTNTHKPGL